MSNITKISPFDHSQTSEDLKWLQSSGLAVVVVGASGDLAKKKTYPALLALYDDNLLPDDTVIWGYARSVMTDDQLRDRLRPYLLKTKHTAQVVDNFLQLCKYQSGKAYGDIEAWADLAREFKKHEDETPGLDQYNRLFYFAIPPNVFAETSLAIKQTSMQDKSKGFSRLIIEKPFGRDLETFEELNATLAEHFTEDHLYRIDHYLGKEMVQNMSVLRFSNTWFEQVWDKDNIQCVMLTFKEPFGTDGRGGYFDKYGIIRDILQNHLLQVLTLVAMETPVVLDGPKAGKAIRDSKVAVLNAISEIKLEDAVLGQYENYADDPTIKNKDTNCPTYAMLKLNINTPRWAGVPFILKAGKALNERKAEIRIQFKDAPAASFLFPGQNVPRNELVMRMQPHEAVYMKTNVKSPGFASKPIQSELEVNYDTRFFAHTQESNPDAYTRLIFDVLQGKQGAFVRDDELRRAWEIFTPLLHKIENENIRPIIYKQGGRGPLEADDFVKKVAGYDRNEDYVFYEGDVARKSEGNTEKPSVNPKVVLPEVAEEDKCQIGLWGLAAMGQNFALNMASHGFSVCVGNSSTPKVDIIVKRAKDEGNLPITGAKDAAEFVATLKKPRKVIILVQGGKPVDETLSKLAAYMEPGDLIIDGSNEWFSNSIGRAKSLEPKNIHFMGMGISGDEECARNGLSLMLGGPREAFDMVEEILTKCAAQTSTGPCAGYLGPVGSGNYVKMVHDGIEYGDMQLIAEVYDVLSNCLGMTNDEMAALFKEWNSTELSSYLVEITYKILSKKDDLTGKGHVVDYILDKTGMKGTGKWTIEEAAERAVAAPTIASSLDARVLSAQKEEREYASKILAAPILSKVEKEQVINDLRAALYASKVCSYAQGLSLIRAASHQFGWNINLSECVRLWTGGCIIRAELLPKICEAFTNNPALPNLLVDPSFAGELNLRSVAWRRAVAFCVTNGIACPSLSGSLAYLDSYRRARLPANLTQAQRNFFGGHVYERSDAPGRFRTDWTDSR